MMTKAKPNKSVHDIVVTLYQQLNIIEKPFDPKMVHWTADDMVTKNKFVFKNDYGLDNGYVVLDQNNIIF